MYDYNQGGPPQQPDPNAGAQYPLSPTAPDVGGYQAPAQPSPVVSAPPANPYSPGAPVTGPGPMPAVPVPGPTVPGADGSGRKSSPAVPILAGVAALLLVAAAVFGVLYINTNADLDETNTALTEANNTIADHEATIDDLETQVSDRDDQIGTLEDELAIAEGNAEDAEGLQTCLDAIYTLLMEDSDDEDLIDELAVDADTKCAPYW